MIYDQMELEAEIWCPDCRETRFKVRRKPTGREGVFEHALEPVDGARDRKRCDNCECVLERKTDG